MPRDAPVTQAARRVAILPSPGAPVMTASVPLVSSSRRGDRVGESAGHLVAGGLPGRRRVIVDKATLREGGTATPRSVPITARGAGARYFPVTRWRHSPTAGGRDGASAGTQREKGNSRR